MIEQLQNLSIQPNIDSNKYIYNGVYVPRVTEILSSMLHEDYITQWSNGLGFKRKRYKNVLENAAEIGSYTHNFIEQYIKYGTEPDFSIVFDTQRSQVENAFNAFRHWWEIVSKNNINIIFSEQELLCPWFGGTLDLLIEVDNKKYLIDFKTSNHPSYKYFMQLSAYMFILREYMNINVDGCGILLLNKNNPAFNEMMLDFSNPLNVEYMKNCECGFLSLVHSYYYRLQIMQDYKTIWG